MRKLHSAAVLVALTAAAVAQDKVTLTNGDVITGTIKSMADGKVVVNSPVLGEVTIPWANVSDVMTAAQVVLESKGGDTLNRRILGIEAGNLRLEGESPTLPLDSLRRINPPADPEPAWTGTLKINALWTGGNTDRRAVGAAFEASRRTESDRLTADAAWDYSEDKSNDSTSPTFRQWTLNQRRTGAGLKYDYFISKRWYLLATSRVLGDTLADIQLRYTGGVGLGYTWIEDEKTTFLTEAGLSYFNENYRSATPSQDYLAARVAYKLTQALTDKTKFTHGVEAFPSTEDADDIYLQAKTEITTSLTESMIASIAHVLDYDNTPSPGNDRADNRVVLSVGWSF